MVYKPFQTIYKSIISSTLPTEVVLSTCQSTTPIINQRTVINLSSSDYLSYSSSPVAISSVISSLNTFGFGMSSGRIICGTHQIHKSFESSLSSFFQKPDCLLYSSGYDTNTGFFEALLSKSDSIFSDAHNNPSISDGISLCSAQKHEYFHLDTTHLEHLLQSSSSRIKLIVTDAIFPFSGDFAPLDTIAKLAEKYSALLVVDESHSFGTVGDGLGLSAYFGVLNQVDLINSSLAKAMGGATGGFSVGKAEIIQVLRQKSRSYLFTNALSPAVAGTCSNILNDFQENREKMIKRLKNLIKEFRDRMKKNGFRVLGHSESPIAPVWIGNEKLLQDFQTGMWNEGVFVAGLSSPMVEKGTERIRVQLSVGITDEQLNEVVEKFVFVGKRCKVIS